MANLPELQALTSGKKKTQSKPSTLGQFYQNANIAAPSNKTYTGGAVLGTQQSQPQQQRQQGPSDSYLDQLAKTNRNPSQEAEYQSLLGRAQPFNAPDFDALIRPAIEGYEGFISTLQGQLPGTLSQIDQDLQGKIATTNQSIGSQERTIGTAKERQATEQESAANEARRIYNEIQQGLQSRYGGTTGTGAFAGELSGAQTGRNIANIRTTGQQLQKELDDKLVQVQEIGRLAIEDAQRNAESQKQDARNSLDRQIAEIRSKIGETQSSKAQLYASAYENYQNYVRQVDASNTAFLQDLYTRQKQAEIDLDSARQRAAQVGSSANAQDLGGLIESIGQYGLTPSGFTTSYGGGKLSFGQEDEGGDYIDQLISQYAGQ